MQSKAARRAYYMRNRDAIRVQRKAYYAKNKKRIRAYHAAQYKVKRKEWRATGLRWRLANYDRILWRDAVKRAARFGLKCNITVEDCAIPKRCPILDIPLRYGYGKRTRNSPSVDRINNRRGYLKGNVRVISWRANDLKRNATSKELAAIVRFMRRYGA